MKRAAIMLVVIVCLFGTAPTAFSQWTPVAPGIDYRYYALTMSDGKPNNVFVARMDRSNQNCIIDSMIAQGQLRSGRETVPNMVARYEDTINYWGESWGQRSHVIVAINGDGWTASPGPTNGQVISGWQAWRWPDNSGITGFCFKLDRSCFLGGNVRNGSTPGYENQFIYFAGGTNAVPTSVNKARAGGNELIVYTTQFADNTYTDNSGTEVLVEMTRPLVELPLGGAEYVYGTIKQVRQNAGSTPIPFDHTVLSGTGTYATTLVNNCTVGAQIRFQFMIHDYGSGGTVPTDPSDWTKAYASVGCFKYVLKNSTIPIGDWHAGDGSDIRNPRTCVAFNNNYIYFFVCDGRSTASVGMTYPEMGDFCLNTLGAQWASNQDGGGSSTLWINGQGIKNVPSDGSPRAVANGLMMVAVQPKVQSTGLSVAQLVTTNASANLRLGPGTNYGILAVLPAGSQGQIVSQSINGVQAQGYNWWKADFGGSNLGWVAENLLIGGGILPTITAQPAPQTLAVGGIATFTVTASGSAPLAYQWQKSSANLTNGGHYSGATTATLTVADVDINDVADYRCVVTNTYGSATSNAAALTLTGQPTITQQPLPQNACTGTTAAFTVAASAQGTLTYQWQKNGANRTDGGHCAGSTTSTLTISNADGTDAGYYRCVVTNPAGSTYSNQAPLAIDAVYALVGMGGTSSTITGVSSDGAIVAGNNSSGGFIWSTANGVVGLGAGTTTAGVATKNGNVVVGGLNGGNAARWDGNGAGVGSWTTLPLASGTTAWTPLCTSAQNGSPGNVWIAGSLGSTTGSRQAVCYKESDSATSILSPLPTNSHNDSYTYGVSDGGVYAGQYQFNAVSPSGSRQAMGGAPLAALSPIKGAPSTKNEGIAKAISRDGTKAGGWSYSPTSNHQGTVWTIANPTVPTAVPFFGGTDTYDEILALNSNGSVAAGYGSVGGSNKHAIIWDATNGTRDLQTWLTTQYGLALSGWTLVDVRGMSSDGKVMAGTGVHNGSSEAWIVLLGVPGAAPAVTQQPTAQDICTGADATFTVAATGLGTVSYQWQKNEANLTNSAHCAGATTATLTIPGADAGDAGDYQCVLSVGCNNTTSSPASLTVKAATTITQQPAALTVDSGATAQFSVSAAGDPGAPGLSYQWQKNGTNLTDGGHYSGTASATLVITSVNSSDAADYGCVVTAGCGTATSNDAALTLSGIVPPDFDRDGDVDASDFATFIACDSGPDIPYVNDCAKADFNHDDDVDQEDFGIFQRCYSGENNPADPNCAD